MTARWSDYFLTADFVAFWTERLREPGATVCMVLGLGFDARSLVALRRLTEIADTGQVSALALQLQALSTDTNPGRDLLSAVEANSEDLRQIAKVSRLDVATVTLRDAEGFSVGGRSALQAVAAHVDELSAFTHVVVDVSGTPRSVFYPLISFLCSRADSGLIKNLHVCVLENEVFDAQITHAEYGDADYVHTFRMEGSKKIVWMPVLGNDQRDRIRKIHNQLRADCIETVPILPFPASSLRRVDDVLISNSEVLYSELGIGQGNILLCDAQNPFDIYRKIVGVHDYYKEKLERHIGELTTIVSPLSGKLLSLGMLFAAMERRLPVAYVEAGLYEVREGPLNVGLLGDQEPTEIWLAGEPYVTTD